MSATALSPELEELLHDIAEDPRTHLFHATPRQLALALRDMVPVVRPRQADLTNAERHLLKAHREETAKLLRDACLLALCEDPRGVRRRAQIFDAQGAAARAPRRPDLEGRALRIGSFAESEAALYGAPGELIPVRVLLGCVRPDTSLISQLGVGSLRMVPSFQASVYLGVDCGRSRMSDSERRIFERLGQSPSSRVRSYAYAGLGLHFETLRRRAQALDLYKRASLLPNRLFGALVSWFALSIEMEQEASALDAAKLLDTSLAPRDERIEAYRHSVRQSRMAAPRDRKAQKARTLGRIRDALGPTSQEIADVLQET